MQTCSADCVRQGADALDLAANFVARFEEAGRLHAHADARRGAGGDDSTGLEGHALRKLCNDMVNVEDLQAGVGVLPLFAVDEAPDGQLGRVGVELVCRDDAGADGSEAVEALAEIPLLVGGLDIPCGDIVQDGVAEDVVFRLTCGNVLRVLSQNDGQFTLVVQLFTRSVWASMKPPSGTARVTRLEK